MKLQRVEMEVAQMKLRFSLEVTRMERIKNEDMGRQHIIAVRQKWFRHVQRTEGEYVGRWMPDQTGHMDIVREDMSQCKRRGCRR